MWQTIAQRFGVGNASEVCARRFAGVSVSTVRQNVQEGGRIEGAHGHAHGHSFVHVHILSTNVCMQFESSQASEEESSR